VRAALSLSAAVALIRKPGLETGMRSHAMAVPVTDVTVTNPLKRVTVTSASLAFGAPVQVKDQNGNTTVTDYDPLGRITSVSLPGHPGGTPSWRFSYDLHVDGTHPVTQPAEVTTRQLMDGSGSTARWLDSYAYLDGYGRTVETQAHSPAGQGRTVTEAWYNSRGLTAAVTAPFWDQDKGAGSGMDQYPDDKIPSLTATAYDALQRPVSVTLSSTGKPMWATATRYAANVTIVAPPSGGATATWADGHGRTFMIQQNYPARRGSPPLDMATTRYSWTPAGQLATITGPTGSVTSYTWDWAGNKTAAHDPDAGNTAYRYDASGQVISETDARGETTSTTYDALGRQTGLWAGQAVTGTQLAGWTYDTVKGGIGQPATSTSYSGRQAYSTSITGYDPRYDITGEDITVPATPDLPDGLAGTYGYQYGYDQAGHQVSMTYPAAGDLPGEKVTAGYSGQGLPDTLTGQDSGGPVTYVHGTAYYGTGQLHTRDYGTPGTPGAERAYAWEPATGRLASITTTVAGTPLPVQDDTYTYGRSGDPLSVTDLAKIPGSDVRNDVPHLPRRKYRGKVIVSSTGLPIDSESAREWARRSLAGGSGLAQAVACRLAGFRAARVLTSPDRLENQAVVLDDTGWRIPTSVADDIASRLLGKLGRACVSTLVVEDDLARRGDPHVGGAAFAGDRVLRWEELDRDGGSAARLLRRGASGYPLNAFVCCGAAEDLGLGSGRELTAVEQENLAGSACVVIVSVWDAESYVALLSPEADARLG